MAEMEEMHSTTPSLVDRLAATIPAIQTDWKAYRDNERRGRRASLSGQAWQLASHVIDLISAGRGDELTAFFAALDEIYLSELDEMTSVAMYEGFMEDLIMGVGHRGLDPAQVYRHLQSESRLTWEDLWSYVRGTPWSDVEASREQGSPGS